MSKIDTNKLYILEDIMQEGGLFKKEYVNRHKCYATLVYEQGNANPPTHLYLRGTDGCGGGMFELSKLKLNTWVWSKRSGYKGEKYRYRIIEA